MAKWGKIKEKIKSFACAFAAVAVISQSLLANTALAAQNPRFNFLPDDKKLLRGANESRGDEDWSAPVTGLAGDTFAGIIYYHNGYENTVARDTRVRIGVPTQTVGGQAVLTASVWAENADQVSDDLTVSLDNDAAISFVPGSVKWFPNHISTTDPSVSLPYGQSGDEILSSEGLKIGDVQGCWQYSGFITFLFKTEKVSANIIKSKIAKNLQTGETGVDISAYPGDEIQYTLATKNNGDGVAEGFVVGDNISDILEYADIENLPTNNFAVSNGIISWPAIDILPGQNVVDCFTVKIRNILPNTPPLGLHYDFIMQNVYGNEVFVRLQKPAPKTAAIAIEKTVRNFTSNEAQFVKENEAFAGDTLEYKIDIENTGEGSADNVLITDTLPANTQYLPGTTMISLNGEIDRTFVDTLATSGASINLAPGDHVTIKFRVLTSAQIAAGEILTNTANAEYNEETISAIAKTKIKKVAPPVTPQQPELPKTGAETFIIALLLGIGGITTSIYWNKRRELAKKMF